LLDLERDQVKWGPVNRPIARPMVNIGHDQKKIDHALANSRFYLPPYSLSRFVPL